MIRAHVAVAATTFVLALSSEVHAQAPAGQPAPPGYPPAAAPAPYAPAPAPAPYAPAPYAPAPAPYAPPPAPAPAPYAPAPAYGPAPAPYAPAPAPAPYGAPAPAPGYGPAPAPYGAPPPYGAPAQPYGAPPPYGAPAPGYGAPPQGYGQPPQGYPPPQQGYPPPQQQNNGRPPQNNFNAAGFAIAGNIGFGAGSDSGFALGARAGYTLPTFNLYLGADLSFVFASATIISIAPELGYDVTFGRTPVVLRPYVGLGYGGITSGGNLGSGGVEFYPGAELLYYPSKNFYVGVDFRLPFIFSSGGESTRDGLVVATNVSDTVTNVNLFATFGYKF